MVRLPLEQRWNMLAHQADCLRLPLDSRRVIAGLRAGGGQRVEAVGILPAGQLACACGLVAGQFAIAEVRIEARGQYSRKALVGHWVFGIDAGERGEVSDGLVKCLFLFKRVSPIDERAGVFWIELDGTAEIGYGSVDLEVFAQLLAA